MYLGLGANLGDKEANLHKAIQLIGEQIGNVCRQSAFYYSEPWGYDSPNAFVNAVILVETVLTPHRLLRATRHIERQLGKRPEHATDRPSSLHPSPSSSPASHASPPTYHDRPIDIDILLYDDLHISTPTLQIPHPLMKARDFVMIPLNSIMDNDPKASAKV